MEIKDYKSGDEVEILKLFQLSFGKSMSEQYWKWRFTKSPIQKTMIKLMWHNDILAGHYAVSPLRLNINGDRVLTALSMTTMTHPDYAGKGIFTDLAEALYKDENKKSGLKAVWGFPNNNSHYGFIKNLSWIDIEQIPTLSINIDKIKKSEFSIIKTIDFFNKKHIDTYNEITHDYRVKIEKTVEYLAWRYTQNPSYKYEIFELADEYHSYFAVTKIFKSFTIKDAFEIDILELSFPPVFDVLLALMNAIVNYYKNQKLVRINIWLPINDRKHILMEKLGFTNALPITYFGIRTIDSGFIKIEDLKSWIYSMGDSDIY